MRTIVNLIVLGSLLLLLSCGDGGKTSPAGQKAAEWQQALLDGQDLAEAHYQLATLYRNEPAMMPLVIWHLQKFLEHSEPDDPRLAEARLLIEHCEKKYYAELQARLERSSDTDKDLKIRFLEENNQQLKQWITRLNRENFALRDLLLDKEKGAALRPAGGAPAKISPPEVPGKATRVHQVAAGDTLSRIAQKYYGAGGPAEIRNILLGNPALEKKPDQLKIGDRIIIPPAQP